MKTMASATYLFCRVKWMNTYRPEEFGYEQLGVDGGPPVEVFNFMPLDGWMYGCVWAPSGRIRIERLKAQAFVNHAYPVTVIWVARKAEGQPPLIVGWYQRAQVYSSLQYLKTDARLHLGSNVPWNIKARTEDCVLLRESERVYALPASGNGTLGTANIFYADSDASARLRAGVSRYLESVTA